MTLLIKVSQIIIRALIEPMMMSSLEPNSNFNSGGALDSMADLLMTYETLLNTAVERYWLYFT